MTDRMRLREERKRHRHRARAYVDHYLETHPCVVCGMKDTRVLQFHHRDPDKKKYKVSKLVGQGASLPLIAVEIEKCDVMCCNCHTILHNEERGRYE